MFGRIAVTSGALPTVLPVNFCLLGDKIVIRTGRGTTLDAATDNAVVAFEVDDLDAHGQGGWSVVVTGIAREITLAAELAAAGNTSLIRWTPDTEGRVVGISTELVTGRRIVLPP